MDNHLLFVKRMSLAVIVLLLSVQTFAGSYTIVFKQGTNGNGSIIEVNAKLYSDVLSAGSEYLSSNKISSATNAYECTNWGLKIGKSNASGSFLLTMSEKGTVQATSIVVHARSYSETNQAQLTLYANGTNNSCKVGQYTLNNPTNDFGDYQYSLSSPTVLSSLSLASNKYCCIESITIHYSGNVSSVTVGELGYASLYVDHEVSIPDGVEAYYATKNGDYAVLYKIDNVIPAFTGVIVKAPAGNYTLVDSNTSAPALSDNLLVGYGHDVQITGSSDLAYYALNYKTVDNVKIPGFLVPKGAGTPNGSFTAKAHKAYLCLPNGSADAIEMRFGDTTLLEELRPEQSDEIYDLMGRRVERATKGIYIINGKKVLVR